MMLIILIFITINLNQNFLNAEENEVKHFCRVKKNNLPGYCTISRACLSVYNEIKRGDRSFTSCQIPNQPTRQLHVCCPDQSIKDPNENDELNNYPLTRTYQKKCKEYQEASYVYIKSYPVANEPEVLIKKSKCGHKVEPLVVGGVDVKPREFPHMASLGFIEQIKNNDNTTTNITNWKCGGSLISERYVLTAAHCFIQNGVSPKVVRVGEIDFSSNDEESEPEDFLIDELIPHPDYKKDFFYNDIGLIRLQKDVKINPFKRPACLPSFPISNDINRAIASGWGATNTLGIGTNEKLLKVTLEKFTYDECIGVYQQFSENNYFSNGIDKRTQICYGSHNESKDTCNGDSGGPLQLYVTHKDINCMYEIIGVTSFGILCGIRNIPAVYTKVYHYIDWIENIAADCFMTTPSVDFGLNKVRQSITTCTLKNTGLPGVCKTLRQCATVFQDIKSGRRDFTICEMNNGVLLVCCPQSTYTTTTQTPTDKLKNISMIKCREYAAAVFQKTYSIPLTAGSQPRERPTDTCGVKTIPLIVGGQLASSREFPHMALLGYGEDKKNIKWACGGTLISERFILTAAHCINTRLGTPKHVRLGELDLNVDDDDSEDFEVEESIVHPDFKRLSKYNDIALVKLNRNVTFSPNKRPACLPVQHDSNATRSIATGWGKTEWAGSGSEHLQKVTLKKFTESECNKTYAAYSNALPRGIQYETQICAGSKYEAKDTCQGDSGGPLQIYHTNEYCMYQIIGITSFGILCGSPGVPGVYTRVFPYNDWIERIVWN
ncbi:uncharacterized protein LOC129614047 [Condylostylus longicornis]|uniref:uncharacterized protein LOC129614047 n=1 Tax=Condylostylus longicornis TaxID=2530218 RepID=UPI00244DBA85|nr:uncharacterized protein LOC129614047 [Condylostylus longicornis]